MATSHFPSGGTGSPAGSDEAVQFNDNGVFGGFGTWDGATVTVAGDVAAVNIAGSGAVTGATFQPATGYKSVDASAGITQDVTTATLVGKTLSFKNGICTGFA